MLFVEGLGLHAYFAVEHAGDDEVAADFLA